MAPGEEDGRHSDRYQRRGRGRQLRRALRRGRPTADGPRRPRATQVRDLFLLRRSTHSLGLHPRWPAEAQPAEDQPTPAALPLGCGTRRPRSKKPYYLEDAPEGEHEQGHLFGDQAHEPNQQRQRPRAPAGAGRCCGGPLKHDECQRIGHDERRLPDVRGRRLARPGPGQRSGRPVNVAHGGANSGAGMPDGTGIRKMSGALAYQTSVHAPAVRSSGTKTSVLVPPCRSTAVAITKTNPVQM